MGEDSFDKEKFLRGIDEAIPKYEKTLKHLKDILLYYEEARKEKEELEIQKKIRTEKTKIEQAIENLKITRQIYSTAKREPDFNPEDYNEDEYRNKSQQDIKSSDNLEESLEYTLTGIQKHLVGTKKILTRNQEIAAGSLILTIAITIGITFLLQGTSTHTQLDIFLLSNNMTEFDQNKIQNYENLVNKANNNQGIGVIILIAGYLLGVYIILGISSEEKTESAGGSKSSRQAELEAYEKDYLARLEEEHNEQEHTENS